MAVVDEGEFGLVLGAGENLGEEIDLLGGGWDVGRFEVSVLDLVMKKWWWRSM